MELRDSPTYYGRRVSKEDFVVNVLGTKKECMVGSDVGNCTTNVGFGDRSLAAGERWNSAPADLRTNL